MKKINITKDFHNLDKKGMDVLIMDRYQETIKYYWNSSKSNKQWYKITRSLTIILGATLTLIASLSSSEFFTGNSLEIIFAFATPILAALLTIIAGFSQSYQWGSTWQNMVLTAERLQKEFDSYVVTPDTERNLKEEAIKLNDFIIEESSGFFERMLGTPQIGNNGNSNGN